MAMFDSRVRALDEPMRHQSERTIPTKSFGNGASDIPKLSGQVRGAYVRDPHPIPEMNRDCRGRAH